MTQTATQQTCAERVEQAKDSRLEDIQTMLDPQAEHFTIERKNGEAWIFWGDMEHDASEEASDCDETLLLDHMEAIVEEGQERFNEYGLSFGYVHGEAPEGKPGYFSYLISWGGPSEEIRYYVDASLNAYRVEFWLLDWFDGAPVTLENDDLDTAMMAWNNLTCDAEPEVIRRMIEA